MRESEERMFVCDNILNKKKRESKDLSLTDKNTRENKTNLKSTHWKHMMKGAES